MENAELLERLLAVMEQNQTLLRKEIREGQESLREEIRKEFREGQESLREEFREGQESLREEFREGQESLRRSQEVIKKDLIEQFTAAMNEQSEMLIKVMDKKVHEAETRINIKIEHEVDSKIKALFDGYQLAHEKQWELERHTERLQNQVDELETRVETLETKTA